MVQRFVQRHQTGGSWLGWLKAGLGAFVAFSVALQIGDLTGAPMIVAPMGASAVLIYGVPQSPLSQPAHVVGSHFIAAGIALAVVRFLPGGPWTLAGTVGGSNRTSRPAALDAPAGGSNGAGGAAYAPLMDLSFYACAVRRGHARRGRGACPLAAAENPVSASSPRRHRESARLNGAPASGGAARAWRARGMLSQCGTRPGLCRWMASLLLASCPAKIGAPCTARG